MAQRATLHVRVITATTTVFDGEADMVLVPGSEGELGILPRHAPLLTTLDIGELRVRRNGRRRVAARGGAHPCGRDSAAPGRPPPQPANPAGAWRLTLRPTLSRTMAPSPARRGGFRMRLYTTLTNELALYILLTR